MDGTKKTKEIKLNIDMVQLEKSFIPDCFLCVKEIWKMADYVFGENGENIGLALDLEWTDKKDILSSMEKAQRCIYVEREARVYDDSCIFGGKAPIELLKETGKEWEKVNKFGMAKKDELASGQERMGDDKSIVPPRAVWIVYLKSENNENADSKVCQIMLDTMAELLKSLVKDTAELSKENIIQIMEACFSDEKMARDIFAKLYCQQVFSRYSQLPSVEACNLLGLQDYEGSKPKGMIAFVPAEYKGKGLFVDVKDNNAFEDYKFTRKMLECAEGDLCLLVKKYKENDKDKYKILGWAKKENIKETTQVILEYLGLAEWCIKDNDEEVLMYKRGKYCVSASDLSGEYKRKLKKYLPDDSDLVESIATLIMEMQQCEHGALLIVTEELDSGDKCKKAKNGIKLREPMKFDELKEYIKGIASVDGAVILNYNKTCQAFSVILERDTKIVGDSGRGSRYNSARNYIAGKNAIAVVISADKSNGVDVLYGKDEELVYVEDLT